MNNTIEDMINRAKRRPNYWLNRLVDLIDRLLYKYYPPYRKKVDKQIDEEIGY